MEMMGLLGSAMIVVCAAMFAFIIAGLVFHRIVGAYIEGDIGGLECIVLGGLFVGFMLCCITMPSSPSAGITGVAVLLLMAAFPAVKWHMNRRANREYFDDRIGQYRDLIAANPSNRAARERLAETLYDTGHLTEAIEEYKALVALAPNSLPEAHRLWRLEKELEEKDVPVRVCPWCGSRNSSDRTKCQRCEADLILVSRAKKWLVSGGLKKMATSYSVMAGVLAVSAVILCQLSAPGRFLILGVGTIVFLIAQLVVMYMNW